MRLGSTIADVRHALDACDEELTTAYVQAVEIIGDALERGGTLYLLGNGGSAADAQHLAAELIGRMRFDRQPLRGIALTTDTSALTALVNDYDPLDVFARQVQALVRAGDVLIAISTSGESANVIRATQMAHRHNASVIALTRRGNTALGRAADVVIGVPAYETPIIQVLHIMIGQSLLEDVEARLGLTPSADDVCENP